MNKMFKIFVILSVLAVLTTVSAADYVEEEGVLVLGDNDLAQAIKEFEHILVEFYAPWCGHCKRLAPEYIKAAALLKEEGSQVRLAKVDATEHPKSGEQYNVQGYPTLKFFIRGEEVEYEGGRTDKEIVSWLRKKTQPSTSEVASAQHLSDLTKANKVVVVFFGGKDHESWSAFETVSKRFDDAIFVYTSSADIRSEQKVPEGTHVLLLKQFDELRNELPGTFDVATLNHFINEHIHPLVLPFDQKAAQRIFGESIPTLFLIYMKNEAGQKAEIAFNEAAQKLKGKIQLSISNINDYGLGPKLAEFVGVTGSDTPAIRLVEPLRSSAPKKFVLQNEITADNIVQFFEDYKSEKITPFLKSEPIPETNDGPVKIVVGKNFKDIVLDPTKDVFVEYYAPWCGHCKQLAPVLDELATQLSSIKNLVIAKMDATANEVESVDVQGFPTLKFYPANNKDSPIDYDGDRTKEGLISWLKPKLTVEHSEANWARDEL